MNTKLDSYIRGAASAFVLFPGEGHIVKITPEGSDMDCMAKDLKRISSDFYTAIEKYDEEKKNSKAV